MGKLSVVSYCDSCVRGTLGHFAEGGGLQTYGIARAPTPRHGPLSMTGRPYISSPASRGALFCRVGNASGQEDGVAVIPDRHKNEVAVQTDMNKTYRPSDKEPFMNECQRDYFRDKLLAWRGDILKVAKETLQHLQDENQNHADFADRASSETDRALSCARATASVS